MWWNFRGNVYLHRKIHWSGYTAKYLRLRYMVNITTLDLSHRIQQGQSLHVLQTSDDWDQDKYVSHVHLHGYYGLYLTFISTFLRSFVDSLALCFLCVLLELLILKLKILDNYFFASRAASASFLSSSNVSKELLSSTQPVQISGGFCFWNIVLASSSSAAILAAFWASFPAVAPFSF